jgi:hypothetical protein
MMLCSRASHPRGTRPPDVTRARRSAITRIDDVLPDAVTAHGLGAGLGHPDPDHPRTTAPPTMFALLAVAGLAKVVKHPAGHP